MRTLHEKWRLNEAVAHCHIHRPLYTPISASRIIKENLYDDDNDNVMMIINLNSIR
jgi:hypothetical protein